MESGLKPPAGARCCGKCGYDLAGAPAEGSGGLVSQVSGRCPECGTVAVPRCAECGYDLSGLIAAKGGAEQERCPECGVEFDPAGVKFLPNLPGFWYLAWVCVRPAAGYLGAILLVGLLVARRPPAMWGGALACLGPPLLLGITLGTVVSFTEAHYIERDRWWVVFLMVVVSLGASALVAVVCSLGLGAF